MSSPESPHSTALLLLGAVPPAETHPQLQLDNSLEYRGSVFQEVFTIKRNLNYNNPNFPLVFRFNAFVPVLVGRLRPEGSGTRIEISAVFDLHITLVAGIFYAFLIASLVFYIRDAGPVGAVNWDILDSLALYLLILLYIWQIVSFNYEVQKAKKFLQKTVMAR